MTATPPKKSDHGVRTLSAVVMVAVAGTALWLGGWVWTAFVALVALGVLWEWWGLVSRMSQDAIARLLWISAALIYVSIASVTLWALRENRGIFPVLLTLGTVIATDVGAYSAGRTFGGPKIAAKISPSKTWSGLAGGMLAAGAMLGSFLIYSAYHADSPSYDDVSDLTYAVMGLALGSIAAIIAQAGDFFESWLKRRANVKDSGSLIPGHGGLFDRVDGLLAVCFVTGLFLLPNIMSPL